MLEALHVPGLLEESMDLLRLLSEARPHELDRHCGVGAGIKGFDDESHSSRTEVIEQLVVVEAAELTRMERWRNEAVLEELARQTWHGRNRG